MHLVLPGAAQHSLEVGANHLRASLAQQHGSSLAQHANHIPLPHASCNIVNKHNSQRLSACAEGSFVPQSSVSRYALNSSLSFHPLNETLSALVSYNKYVLAARSPLGSWPLNDQL